MEDQYQSVCRNYVDWTKKQKGIFIRIDMQFGLRQLPRFVVKLPLRSKYVSSAADFRNKALGSTPTHPSLILLEDSTASTTIDSTFFSFQETQDDDDVGFDFY